MNLFHGAYVALLTPFKKSGEIDRKSLEKQISWQIESGTDGIVCCATTGEGPVLNEREKKRVAAICLEIAEGRIPVVVSVGTASTAQTVRFTEEMQQLGAAGCLVVTPYYNKPSALGCIAHYREIAQVGLPLIPYYNPSRTGSHYEPETLATIGKIPNVVALKDSSGEIGFIRQLRKLSSIPIFSGDDFLTLETISEGGVGAISVIGNLFPKQWKEMISLALQGKYREAKKIHDRYLPLCKALFLESNPQCVKWTANWFGLTPSFFRLPLLEPQESTKKVIRQVILQMALPHLRFLNLDGRNQDGSFLKPL